MNCALEQLRKVNSISALTGLKRGMVACRASGLNPDDYRELPDGPSREDCPREGLVFVVATR